MDYLQRLAISTLVLGNGVALAQELPLAQEQLEPAAQQKAVIVITATRSVERAFDLPIAIDSVNAEVIQRGNLQSNLSESLNRVPGIVVQNRQNYAQDLQVSSRGFGARASFGVRGVRLYQDGIPATMPDGQGQSGSFSLISAQRIEVLRGPFSSLYGNASGGVVQVFTEDGPDRPTLTPLVVGGSYRTLNTGLKLGGQATGINYVIAGNHFETTGYREHSAAQRQVFNTKFKFSLGENTRVTVIGNTLYQPESQDPLGLTRAQWQANPRGVDLAASQFDTRKTVRQLQSGLAIDHRLTTDTSLHLTGYGGSRRIRQYLAFAGTAPASSGGVTDLDRHFAGVGLRLTARFDALEQSLKATIGADFDIQNERRRGFVNNRGLLGELRRDEDDRVSNADGYAQLEWALVPQWTVHAGVRISRVKFRSDDHYLTADNPDDSGSRDYGRTIPVAGMVFHASETLNVYANAGEGFETPTQAELAYRTGGPGLNFELRASRSRSVEAGAKVAANKQRINIAVFQISTVDEIVIDTAAGGRTTFKNAGKTQRRGIEALWYGPLAPGFTGYMAYTYLSAQYKSPITTGTPPATIPAGSRLPGVPQSSLYAELVWSYPAWYGLSAALEFQHISKVYVDDRNSDAAPSYSVTHARAGFEQRSGAWTLREFVRVNNVANRKYAGSVIVGDTNGRYFEPAPGRNYLFGISITYLF